MGLLTNNFEMAREPTHPKFKTMQAKKKTPHFSFNYHYLRPRLESQIDDLVQGDIFTISPSTSLESRK